MKTKIIFLLIIQFTTFCFAQTVEAEKLLTNTEEVKAVESEPMPYNRVELPPLAPNCKEKWKPEKKQKCTREFINSYINRRLNTDLVSELGLTGFFRIDLTFTIDKEGKSKNISATGGPEIMNQNAMEVIQTLPQLTPAMHNGELVEVYYKVPIAFSIQ
jgi:protein TonB